MAYTAQEVAKMTDTPYRSLMRWVEMDLLHPEGALEGRRRPTVWHPKDVREASVLNALRRAGVSLQKIRKAVQYLKSIGHNPLSTGDFVVIRTSAGDPAQLIKFCDTGEAISLLRSGQLVFPLWVESEN